MTNKRSGKKNLSYFQKRFLSIGEDRDIADSQYIKDMSKRYEDLSYSIKLSIDDWVEKYAVNDQIAEDEARQMISKHEQTGWSKSLEEFRELAIAGDYTQELNRDYFVSRVSRLNQLQRQLYFQLAEQASVEQAHLNHYLKQTVVNTMNRQIYELTDRGAFEISFEKYDVKKLNAAINKPWKSSNFSKRIWNNHLNVIPDKLSKVMAESITQGYGIDKTVSKMMEGVDGTLKSRMITLVQTESAHLASVASDKAYEETGVERYQWLATLEVHTCSVCGDLDLEIFEVADKKAPRPPDPHPNCRCIDVPYIEDVPMLKRWHRDPLTGKGGSTEFKSFKEWADEHITPEVKRQLKIEKNRPADKKQHRKYRQALGKEVPQKVNDFIDLKYNDVEKYEELMKMYKELNKKK